MAKPKRPGIHHDVPFAEYKLWPYVNNSSLTPALKTGLDYQHELQNPSDQKDRAFQHLMHALILEPHTVDQRFVMEPDFVAQMLFGPHNNPKLTDEYKAIKAKFYASNTKEAVTDDEWVRAHKTAVAVKRSVRWLFKGECRTEVSVVSVEPETGQRVKVRLDLWRPDDCIVDFKFTSFLDDFEREIMKWDYHRQAAFYVDAMRDRTGETLPYWIVAYDGVEPHFHCRAAQLSNHALGVGRRRYMRAMRVIDRGLSTGKWEGYPRTLRWRLRGDKTVDGIFQGKHIEL